MRIGMIGLGRMGALWADRADERHLRTLPLRERAGLLIRIEPEAPEEVALGVAVSV
jgi:hypothetical protein